MPKMYLYGVTFWNPDTDDEIACYLEAESHWHAQREVSNYSIPGYKRGGAIYIEQKDKSFYTKPLYEVAERQA